MALANGPPSPVEVAAPVPPTWFRMSYGLTVPADVGPSVVVISRVARSISTAGPPVCVTV